ncbi:hypothetical protein BC567DRAFT_42128 [Phyllosticta citribraziliensis]
MRHQCTVCSMDFRRLDEHVVRHRTKHTHDNHSRAPYAMEGFRAVYLLQRYGAGLVLSRCALTLGGRSASAFLCLASTIAAWADPTGPWTLLRAQRYQRRRLVGAVAGLTPTKELRREAEIFGSFTLQSSILSTHVEPHRALDRYQPIRASAQSSYVPTSQCNPPSSFNCEFLPILAWHVAKLLLHNLPASARLTEPTVFLRAAAPAQLAAERPGREDAHTGCTRYRDALSLLLCFFARRLSTSCVCARTHAPTRAQSINRPPITITTNNNKTMLLLYVSSWTCRRPG